MATLSAQNHGRKMGAGPTHGAKGKRVSGTRGRYGESSSNSPISEGFGVTGRGQVMVWTDKLPVIPYKPSRVWGCGQGKAVWGGGTGASWRRAGLLGRPRSPACHGGGDQGMGLQTHGNSNSGNLHFASALMIASPLHWTQSCSQALGTDLCTEPHPAVQTGGTFARSRHHTCPVSGMGTEVCQGLSAVTLLLRAWDDSRAVPGGDGDV